MYLELCIKTVYKLHFCFSFISVAQVLPNLTWEYNHNSECCILSCGWFPGVLFSVPTFQNTLFHLHIGDRHFKNIITENSDTWESPKRNSDKAKVWSQNSVVSSVTVTWNEWAGVWILAGARYFSLLQIFKTNSGAHPAHYSMDGHVLYPVLSSWGMMFTTHLHLALRLRMSSDILCASPFPSWHA